MANQTGPALDPSYRRARTDLQKSERTAAILLAARQEFDAHGFAGFTMRAVGERVHISKAALYGYHASKHAILATLTTGMLASWARALADRLAGQAAAEPDAVAAEVLASLDGRDTLIGLLDVLGPCVEPGLTDAERHQHDALMAGALATAGEALESALPGIPPGEGPMLARATLAVARTHGDASVAVPALLRGASRP